jgi:hypothetical protein
VKSQNTPLKLPYTHQNQNYLLACQCTPTTNMQLVAKTSDDNITQCMAMTLSQTSHQTWQLSCEAYRELSYQMGQSVMMTDLAMQNATLATLISDPEQGTTLDLEIQGQDISWLTQHDVIEGTEFYIRGTCHSTNPSSHKVSTESKLMASIGR